MLITDRFVMLNFPKTGSSFARSVLKELHAPTTWQRLAGRFVKMDTGLREELVVPYRFRPTRHAYPSQHGVYVQIPQRDRGKTIMSIMRDPLERLVSAYEFKHWTRYQEGRLDSLRKRFPAFPELSFEEFIQMVYDLDGPDQLPEDVKLDIGPLTTQYVRFFALDPLRTIRSLHDGMDLAAVRDEHFAPVRFLHQEKLADELVAFLAEMGYPSKKLASIAHKPRVNTTERTRSEYLTPDILDRVLHRERFLFQLLPEYASSRHQTQPHVT